MVTNKDLVTVYIPTYNRLKLLERAVDSIIKQTYKNIEIIIVDDGSTDGTAEYIEQLFRRHKNIHFYCNTANQGACYSRNQAIIAANGKFITGLDDDDYFLPDRINDFIQKWPDSPDTVALYTNLTYKRADGSMLVSYRPKITSRKDMLYGCQTGCQVFTKTEYLRQISGFDQNLPMWQDLECWYRLLALGEAFRVDNASYIVDISHPHERISQKGSEKILNTYQYFCQKHSLRPWQKIRLKFQTLRYYPSIFKYFLVLFQALFFADVRLARLCISNIKMLIKNK